ncbi:MAG: hypothetical protein CVV56_06985 [Tenericutes bacterium HGW-Tenericutes-1]|nr:MAG: hypothetical protein CVV56_06985 [Tenericutes bacterium HGW-Tenericutes-1]
MKTVKPINYKRIFALPLILTTIFIFVLSVVIYSMTISAYREYHQNDAIIKAKLISENITENIKYQKLLLDSIDDSLLTTARIAISNQDLIDNEYLLQLTEITNTEYIYYYSPTGEVIYDPSDMYIGWQAQVGDPIYDFMTSGETIRIEDIRKSTDEDNYYKFAYLKANDGYFIQVGVRAEYVLELTAPYEYQNVIEDIVIQNDEVIYALILDGNKIAIADSNEESIGIDYSSDGDYELAINGVPVATDHYYAKDSTTVLEIAYPIYEDGEIIGILAVGYALSFFNQTRIYLIIIFIIMGISFVGIYFMTLYIQIFKPLRGLDDAISSIDVESTQSKRILDEKSVFSGIYQTVDNLSKRITDENSKNIRLNKRISSMAYTDYLTGVPNRLAFIEKITEIIKSVEKLAVVFFDLDGFKSYNDTLGHNFGDALLKSFTNRFNSVKDNDTYFARYGGDEFFMYHRYHSMVDLRSWIENVASLFDQPFEVEGVEYPLDAGIGVSLYPEHDTSIEQLIRKADIAMYYSKKRGKNFVEFYNDKMDVVIRNDTEVIKKLKQAIKNDGFNIVYQPQVNIDTNEIVSIEALLRVKDENISPSVFIPLAEQGGIINMIGRIVLKNVIEQMAIWKSKGAKLVTVFVNLSSHQLEDDGLIQYIQDLLYEYDIHPSYLGIEMTESAVIKRELVAYQFLKDLDKLGIHTAIDDFGSGHAGLSYLTKYHVEMVKLDRQFCIKYLTDQGLPIFNAIVGLTKLLNFKVLAEGIETLEHINYLKQTDCHLVQGYYYYLPSHPDIIEKVLIKSTGEQT